MDKIIRYIAIILFFFIKIYAHSNTIRYYKKFDIINEKFSEEIEKNKIDIYRSTVSYDKIVSFLKSYNPIIGNDSLLSKPRILYNLYTVYFDDNNEIVKIDYNYISLLKKSELKFQVTVLGLSNRIFIADFNSDTSFALLSYNRVMNDLKLNTATLFDSNYCKVKYIIYDKETFHEDSILNIWTYTDYQLKKDLLKHKESYKEFKIILDSCYVKDTILLNTFNSDVILKKGKLNNENLIIFGCRLDMKCIQIQIWHPYFVNTDNTCYWPLKMGGNRVNKVTIESLYFEHITHILW